MIDEQSVLFTGGTGLLGTEIKKILPNVYYPTRLEFDITDIELMDKYLTQKKIKTIIHAAAFTSPPKVDQNPIAAIDANIVGTSNIVKLCIKHSIKLIYISTDYVFKGDKGNYTEEDSVHPVNKYAWSKLGGECAIRMYENSLIIRTTFGPNVFPYEKAFSDQWTSRQSVSLFAQKIYKILTKPEITGVLHVGEKRRTVLDYAKSLDPTKEIKPLSVKEVTFKVPIDTSLDIKRYNDIFKGE